MADESGAVKMTDFLRSPEAPLLVCVGCGKETTVDENPVCEDCVRRMWSWGEENEDKPWFT